MTSYFKNIPDDVLLNIWQRSCLPKQTANKEPDEQVIAEAQTCREELWKHTGANADSFGKWVRHKIGSQYTKTECVYPQMTLSPSEFLNPSWEIEKTVWNIWRKLDIPASYLDSSSYWTACTTRFLASSYLSQWNIRELLTGQKGNNHSTSLQDETRKTFRRLGGLKTVRGNISVRTDTPLGRIAWRGTLADIICPDINSDFWDIAHKFFHSNKPAYAAFMTTPLKNAATLNASQFISTAAKHLISHQSESAGWDEKRHNLYLRYVAEETFGISPSLTELKEIEARAETAFQRTINSA